MEGVPAFATAAMTGHQVVYGNFADLLIVNFRPLEVLSNPYTLASQGKVSFHINHLADLGPIRPKSFCRSTDSAAQ